MSELVVSQLRDRGIGRLYVANRSPERAEELTRSFGGQVVAWAEWNSALVHPDIIVSSVGAEALILRREAVEHAMASRGNRALFLIDLGVPRNVEASAANLYNVYLYNVDDLSEIVEQNRRARTSEVPKAEGIVEEHVGKFLSWQASVELVSLLDALRSQLKDQRRAFLQARLAAMNHLSEGDRKSVEGLMEEILEKLLIEPAERLRSERNLRRKIQNIEALRDLFLPHKE